MAASHVGAIGVVDNDLCGVSSSFAVLSLVCGCRCLPSPLDLLVVCVRLGLCALDARLCGRLALVLAVGECVVRVWSPVTDRSALLSVCDLTVGDLFPDLNIEM
jgi:hypothetical protein